MNRRECGFALLALAAPRIAWAQARTVRIGVLGPRKKSILFPAALRRLGELGYVEGRNLVLEYRAADGVIERFPALARELIQAKCDLVFAIGSEQAARPLVNAKPGVPVVILAHDYDPVKAGIISSLRRPGGNATGMVNPEAEIAAKRLELMREILPRAKRFLVFSDRFSTAQVEAVVKAAERLRVDIVSETFGAPPYDYEAALARGRAAGSEALVLLTSPVFADQGGAISAMLRKHRLPAASFSSAIEDPGFLIGYGIDETRAYAPAGDIAARILKGEKPAEIAVEQVKEFQLAVNLKTAKALGIAMPQSIAIRATRAIE